MARVGLFMVLCVAAALIAGCGAKQEAAPPAPTQAQKQSGPSVSAATDATAKGQNPKPAVTPTARSVPPLKKFVIEEDTRGGRIKSYHYYVDYVAKHYVKMLEEAVKRPDGFRWVSAYLDSSRQVYAAEKKRIEECYAQGIKLRLVECELASFTKKGRILEEKRDYHLYALKVHVKYVMEYTYPDNWIVKRAERKVFTLEQRQDFVGPATREGSPQIISVIITAIEDDTELAGDEGKSY